MALQLAYYKSHGVAVPTYETASTRLFKHGRTDVIRTLSQDSYKWVRAMVDGKHDVSSSNPKENLLSELTFFPFNHRQLNSILYSPQQHRHTTLTPKIRQLEKVVIDISWD